MMPVDSRPLPVSRARMMLRLGWTFARTPRISASKSSMPGPEKTVFPFPFMPGLIWDRGMVVVAASALTERRR